MSDYLYCPTCETSQDRKFTNCLKCGGAMVEHIDTLEAMSTEEFLGWLLTSCKIDEEEFKLIRDDVQDFLLGEMQSAGFNRELLPSLRVPLYNFLNEGAP